MEYNPEIREFIRENSSLFWWIKPEAKMNISINALVEAVLNYGNEKSVKRLFDLFGIKTIADIFYHQISGKRSNYHRRTKHFFQIYFKRHAQRCTNRATTDAFAVNQVIFRRLLPGGGTAASHNILVPLGFYQV